MLAKPRGRCCKVCRIKMKATQLECRRSPFSFHKNGLFALPRRHHQRRPSQDVPVDADGDGEGGRPLYSLDPEAETSWRPAHRSIPECQPAVLSARRSANEWESRVAHRRLDRATCAIQFARRRSGRLPSTFRERGPIAHLRRNARYPSRPRLRCMTTAEPQASVHGTARIRSVANRVYLMRA